MNDSQEVTQPAEVWYLNGQAMCISALDSFEDNPTSYPFCLGCWIDDALALVETPLVEEAMSPPPVQRSLRQPWKHVWPFIQDNSVSSGSISAWLLYQTSIALSRISLMYPVQWMHYRVKCLWREQQQDQEPSIDLEDDDEALVFIHQPAPFSTVIPPDEWEPIQICGQLFKTKWKQLLQQEQSVLQSVLKIKPGDQTPPTPQTEPIFGLVNLGQTCYLNATLQALRSCKFIMNHILSQYTSAPLQEAVSLSGQSTPALTESGRSSPVHDLTPAIQTNPIPPIIMKSASSGSVPSSRRGGTLFSPTRLFTLWPGQALLNTPLPSPLSPLPSESIATKSTLKESLAQLLNPLSRKRMNDSTTGVLMRTLRRLSHFATESSNATESEGGVGSAITKLARSPGQVLIHLAKHTAWLEDKQMDEKQILERISLIQQDAHECYLAFVDGLTDTLSCSVVGQTRTTTQCLCCRNLAAAMQEETPTQRFIELGVDCGFDYGKTRSIRAALLRHSLQSTLTGPNRLLCKYCQRPMESIQQIQLVQLPKVLVFQLKRFAYDAQGYRKRMQRIHVTRTLRLGIGHDPLYRLKSLVVHIGSAPESGHYVAVIRVQNVWWLMDDERVYAMAWFDVMRLCGNKEQQSTATKHYASIYLAIYEQDTLEE